jgi:hypothetical protein
VYIYDAETFRLSYANENARRRMRCELGDDPRLCLVDFFSADEMRRFRSHMSPVLSGECPRAHLEVDHVTGPVEVVTHLDEAPTAPVAGFGRSGRVGTQAGRTDQA